MPATGPARPIRRDSTRLRTYYPANVQPLRQSGPVVASFGAKDRIGMAYGQSEAEDAWQRITTFFDTHLD